MKRKEGVLTSFLEKVRERPMTAMQAIRKYRLRDHNSDLQNEIEEQINTQGVWPLDEISFYSGRGIVFYTAEYLLAGRSRGLVTDREAAMYMAQSLLSSADEDLRIREMFKDRDRRYSNRMEKSANRKRIDVRRLGKKYSGI